MAEAKVKKTVFLLISMAWSLILIAQDTAGYRGKAGIADVADTNLLHRGGVDGLRFAQASASAFLAAGGIGCPGWRKHADGIHQAFVARNLSPGGSADLLAMALFVDALFVDRLAP